MDGSQLEFDSGIVSLEICRFLSESDSSAAFSLEMKSSNRLFQSTASSTLTSFQGSHAAAEHCEV